MQSSHCLHHCDQYVSWKSDGNTYYRSTMHFGKTTVCKIDIIIFIRCHWAKFSFWTFTHTLVHISAQVIHLHTSFQLTITCNHAFPTLRHTLLSYSTAAAGCAALRSKTPQQKLLKEEKVMFPTYLNIPILPLQPVQTRVFMSLPQHLSNCSSSGFHVSSFFP